MGLDHRFNPTEHEVVSARPDRARNRFDHGGLRERSTRKIYDRPVAVLSSEGSLI